MMMMMHGLANVKFEETQIFNTHVAAVLNLQGVYEAAK
jgi:hypothetical protein